MAAPMVRHPGELRWETRLLAVVVAHAARVRHRHRVWRRQPADRRGAGLDVALSQLLGRAPGRRAAASAIARLDYRVWQRLAWPLLLVTIVLLLIPLLPFTYGIAPLINGARRWVQLGPLQPPALGARAPRRGDLVRHARGQEGRRGARLQEGRAAVPGGHGRAVGAHRARAQPLDGHAGGALRRVVLFTAGRQARALPAARPGRDAARGAGGDHGAVPAAARARVPRSRQGGRRRRITRSTSRSSGSAPGASSASASARASRSSTCRTPIPISCSARSARSGASSACAWWCCCSRSSAGWASASRARRRTRSASTSPSGSPRGRAHRVPAHGGVARADADDRAHAAVHVVRPSSLVISLVGAGILINIGRMRGKPAPRT